MKLEIMDFDEYTTSSELLDLSTDGYIVVDGDNIQFIFHDNYTEDYYNYHGATYPFELIYELIGIIRKKLT